MYYGIFNENSAAENFYNSIINQKNDTVNNLISLNNIELKEAYSDTENHSSKYVPLDYEMVSKSCVKDKNLSSFNCSINQNENTLPNSSSDFSFRPYYKKKSNRNYNKKNLQSQVIQRRGYRERKQPDSFDRKSPNLSLTLEQNTVENSLDNRINRNLQSSSKPHTQTSPVVHPNTLPFQIASPLIHVPPVEHPSTQTPPLILPHPQPPPVKHPHNQPPPVIRPHTQQPPVRRTQNQQLFNQNSQPDYRHNPEIEINATNQNLNFNYSELTIARLANRIDLFISECRRGTNQNVWNNLFF
ncbi:unnamed protein product [Brachionus calyciflorus]|uniref:Uncharacterized protein n=1 Tax=Brachionus calyciflorus TaxID=104777 RepID=A0A813WIU9_9BILA|nr:unnamed protein product [Brachionus calyciflorus]